MHTSIFEDQTAVEFIRKRIRALQGQKGLLPCHVRMGKNSSECWCYQADEEGKTIPCPPPVT